MIERLIASWRGLALRERRLVAAAAAVLLAAVGYLVLFEPAWKGRARLAGEIPQLRTQLAQMKALAAEAARLGGEAKAVDSPEALRMALEQSVRAAGLAPGLSALKREGELFELRFSSVSYPVWIEWLDTMQRGTRLRVADASVTKESTPGVVSIRMVFEAPRRAGR